MQPTICCPEILNTTVHVYKACSNSLYHIKVIILPGAKIVHCNNCNSRMTPTSCLDTFGVTVELDNKTLSLPVEVLDKFMKVDTTETYSQNIDAVIQKTLYLVSIDYQYNSKNVITKMWKHI